jgi:hypothetical protein
MVRGDLLGLSWLAITPPKWSIIRGSPGLLVMPMSRLFRSAVDRASVGLEVCADGRAAERGM